MVDFHNILKVAFTVVCTSKVVHNFLRESELYENFKGNTLNESARAFYCV